ncbi:MAG: imidazolonepropionase [Wenzhouxiangellaceae bacterium]|nr:imidazolonepropionase [Wenzhouxiangellaceae bacterium]
MSPNALTLRNARLAACVSGGPATNAGRDELFTLEIRDRTIARIEAAACASPAGDSETVDLAGRVVLPGFIDCHTHACFAGSRLDEWQRKLAGASYLELLEQGGGIMATVRATRAACERELADLLATRLQRMLAHGSTTIEVKSGYGLDTETELKMLRAIARAAETFPGTVVATACIGHAIDPETGHDEFVRRTIDETLPAITAEFAGIALDGYCEQGAWSLDDCLALFDAGQAAGHPIRVHADQFNALGMIEAAAERGFASVDHLEATDAQGLRRLAASETFGVMLPASGFHLDDRFGDGRAFIDAGGQLALASNYNPGSAPCWSMPFVIALAVRRLGLAPAEAIHASTRAGAELLGLADRGKIEAGMRADLVVLDSNDARNLAFEFGGNPVARVMAAGHWLG